MAFRTAWTAGNGAGLTWSPLFNLSDLASLGSGVGVLSSVGDIVNGTNLDMFMDISYLLTLASSQLIPPGSTTNFFLYALNEDGIHYGDNLALPGSTLPISSSVHPCAIVGVPVTTLTTYYGFAQGIVVPPGTFRTVLQVNTGTPLAASPQACQYRTYNINLNN